MMGKLKFDGTIHLGHIIQIVLFLAAIIGLWSSNDKRVTMLETSAVQAKEERIEIRNSLGKMVDSMQSLALSNERLATELKSWGRQSNH